ncbi:MAG: PQQ-dependent sugar dehydrogenase [Planctomycetota bacterium]
MLIAALAAVASYGILSPVPVAARRSDPPLTTVRVASGLARPLFPGSPPGDYRRLFLVEQRTGWIRIIRDGALLPAPFLDIGSLVIDSGNERGLLGLTFHPDYASNGLFYVNYSRNGDTVIARNRVSADPDVADPTSGTILQTIDQRYSNHNGGMLAFGSDGYLYVGMGDGGSANDPQGNGQDLSALLGKILRVDVDDPSGWGIPATNPFVDVPAARGEIWAFGARNPWRFGFDRETGDLYIADVGQDLREEVDFQPATSAGGENYGWRCMEANRCTGLSGCTCIDTALTPPIHEYDTTSAAPSPAATSTVAARLRAWKAPTSSPTTARAGSGRSATTEPRSRRSRTAPPSSRPAAASRSAPSPRSERTAGARSTSSTSMARSTGSCPWIRSPAGRATERAGRARTACRASR